MSKKIVLSHITQEDIDILVSSSAIVSTYRALTLNQFLNEEQINQIKSKLPKLINDHENNKTMILKKYKIPHIYDNSLKIDNDNNMLYVETVN